MLRVTPARSAAASMRSSRVWLTRRLMVVVGILGGPCLRAGPSVAEAPDGPAKQTRRYTRRFASTSHSFREAKAKFTVARAPGPMSSNRAYNAAAYPDSQRY